MKETIRHLTWAIFIFLFALEGCQNQHIINNNNTLERSANALINESSPYLRQHAYNPVQWLAWNEQSLNKAQEENKLILVSIGYAACHWCHVMEHESFEDSTVAEYMNKHYVPIKVDREERPDVDQIYMSAVHLMGQHGGWPLNVICLPDGRPIWGGTYFPKSKWLNVIEQVNRFYISKPEKAEEYAQKLAQGIKSLELVENSSEKKTFLKEDLEVLFPEWKKRFDPHYGGKNGSPKFPMPTSTEYLLEYYYYTKESKALEHIEKSLDHMAQGGIYDQVGGGFARYSTDHKWHVPHFEKMLYDNAQLISLYSHAFQLTKKPLYKEVVYECIEFIKRELKDKNGGFYASLDADSEGEEGKFYIWTKDQIETILGEEATWYSKLYGVSTYGNWEHGKNVLMREESLSQFAKKMNWTRSDLVKKLKNCNQLLLAERSKRIRPGLDDKILTSWNGLMLKGLVDAYLAFNEDYFLELALENANFIKENLTKKDHSLWRSHCKGEAKINAFLIDYATVIDAYIYLYQASLDFKWLKEANNLAEHCIEHFYETNSGMFYYTSDKDPALIARKFELSDNVIPASNSILAKALLKLGRIYDNNQYTMISERMLQNMWKDAQKNVVYYSNWLSLAMHQSSRQYEIVIIGEKAKTIIPEAHKEYQPNTLYIPSFGEEAVPLLKQKYQEGKTMIYVCENKVCQLPTNDLKQAKSLIRD